MPINDPEKSENMRKSIRVYSGSSNRPLAQKIAEFLGVELSGLTLKQFANGEIYARYDETVRRAAELCGGAFILFPVRKRHRPTHRRVVRCCL